MAPIRPAPRSLLFVPLALVAGCSKPSPPTLTPERATVTQIDAQGIGMALEVSAANPNAVDLTAREVTAHVVLAGRFDVGTITIPQGVTLPAGKTTKLDIPASVKWTDLAPLVQLAAAGGAVPYAVDGTLAMGGSLLHVDVPFHLEGVVTHAQVVNATLRSLPGLPQPP